MDLALDRFEAKSILSMAQTSLFTLNSLSVNLADNFSRSAISAVTAPLQPPSKPPVAYVAGNSLLSDSENLRLSILNNDVRRFKKLLSKGKVTLQNTNPENGWCGS
jgi:hypothetical protein